MDHEGYVIMGIALPSAFAYCMVFINILFHDNIAQNIKYVLIVALNAVLLIIILMVQMRNTSKRISKLEADVDKLTPNSD